MRLLYLLLCLVASGLPAISIAKAPTTAAAARGRAESADTTSAPPATPMTQTTRDASSHNSVAAKADDAKGWTAKDITLVLGPFVTALVALVAVLVSVHNTGKTIEGAKEMASAQRWRDANKAELERLEALIHTFHVPYKVLSEANNNMARDLRDRLNNPSFRMLTSLFDPPWRAGLSAGDSAIVQEICRNGRALKAFIEQYGGSADVQLAAHLARAVTHFRMLWLAYKDQLGNDPAPFERYVYPRALDRAIDADLDRINSRCQLLRAQPSVDHGLMPALSLPSDAQLEPWPDPLRVLAPPVGPARRRGPAPNRDAP